MRYTYTCEECNLSETHEFSLNEELPKRLDCANCGAKKSMYHDIRADLSTTSTKIPDHFKAHKMDSEMNYTKMHREQRTFY